MKILEQAAQAARPRWVRVLGLVLVPVLVVAGVLGATWGAGARLHRVEAAVVNLDRAVTVDGRIVPLGRQLSAALVDSSREQNLTWVLADATHADAGLRSGRYAAVVTIPADFSAAATSFGGAPDDARHATIDVQTSEAAGLIESVIGQSVAQAAAQTLNRSLTATYLENVYLGLGEQAVSLRTAADAARQLADASRRLAGGVQEAGDGSRQLADGLGQISARSQEARTGGARLVAGADALSTGLDQSATGAGQLAGGLNQAAAASGTLREGARSLAGGAETLSTGLTTYRDTGLAPYTAGVTQLATSSSQQLQLLIELRVLLDQVQQTSGTSTDLTAYVPQIQRAITTLQTQLGQVQTTPQQLAQQLSSTRTRIDAALDRAAEQAAVCPPEIERLGADACQAYLAGARAAVAQGKAAVQQAFTTPDPTTGLTLQQTLDQLAQRLAALSSSDLAALLQQLNVVLGQVNALVQQAAQDGVPTADQLRQQQAQLRQLAAAGPQLVTGATTLAAGAGTLSSGLGSYADGVDRYTGGVDSAATGATRLAGGLSQAAQGSQQLTTGTRAYVAGVDQMLDGVDQMAPGATRLADGLTQAADGAGQIADGADRMADGFDEGVSRVPTYTDDQSRHLAGVVASPIAVADLDDLVAPATTWAALLAVLALWLGALASSVVWPAMRPRLVLSNLPTWRLTAESLQPAAATMLAQVLAVATAAQLALRLPLGRLAALVGLLALAGLVFVCVNHAFAAWARGTGRVVAVGFAVITVAAAVTAALPAPFAAVRALSPLTPALDGMRLVVSGAPGVSGHLFLLAGWGLVALAASTAAVVRARTVSPRALLLPT